MKRLICFAVTDEKRFFQPSQDDTILVTGMGAAAAEKTLTQALTDFHPDLIIAAGFAGGLNPDLTLGQVVLDDRLGFFEANSTDILSTQDLFKGQIHSASRVLITPSEKSTFRSETNADAVDMESDTIRKVASEKGIPMIALRTVSDTAHESLPLDFNRFMTPDGGMRFTALIGHLMLHLGKIPSLIRFQKRVKLAAQKLGSALNAISS